MAETKETKHIGLRVPASMLERVDALVGQLGADRTAVILALLRQSLAMPGSVEQQLYDVQQALSDVEQRLTTVEQRLTTVQQNVEPKQSRENALQAAPKETAVRSHIENPVASPAPWQTLSVLGKTYKFDSTNASRDAKVRGETMLEFLQRKTGLEWESDGGDRKPLYRLRQGNR